METFKEKEETLMRKQKKKIKKKESEEKENYIKLFILLQPMEIKKGI